ncbi:MAG: transglutaminase-like domain-containing protein [Desulfotignum sp.]|nr:transglutaminase-like domain-containing protein [Desulfotignum sp.]MCF8136218.1 transglutaminase-like domain-containing protein [Desulfotignum sp.]
MKKILILAFCICMAAGISSTASANIYYYSGTMNAAFTLEEKIEISMPSGITKYIYNYPLPQNYDYGINSQSADFPTIIFTPQPDSSEIKTDDFGNQYVELVWNNPLSGTIQGKVTGDIATTADWDQFVTSDLFPVDNSQIPQDAAPFLAATDQVQSDNSMLISLADDLTDGLDQQWQAATAICGWVMDNIAYGPNPNIDAVSTYTDKVGDCSNFSHLAGALLRAAGIPARIVVGLALSNPYSLPYQSGNFTSIDWSPGPHAWLEVYYPSLGWVPYEPQRDLHHIDTRRISYGAGKDEGSLIVGTSQYYYIVPPDSFPSSSSVPTITWTTDNIDLAYVKESDEINSMAFSTPVTFLSSETIELNVISGWNLLSAGIAFNAAKKLSDDTRFASVWKWKDGGWAVYLPGEDTQGEYAAAKDFGVLSTINPGEGFWVNSLGSDTVSIEGVPVTGSLSLTSGWNLAGLKSDQVVDVTTLIFGKEANIASVWKWKDGGWAVYLPGEDTQGDYAAAKDFGVLSTISPGEGFWVNALQAITLE